MTQIRLVCRLKNKTSCARIRKFIENITEGKYQLIITLANYFLIATKLIMLEAMHFIIFVKSIMEPDFIRMFDRKTRTSHRSDEKKKA